MYQADRTHNPHDSSMVIHLQRHAPHHTHTTPSMPSPRFPKQKQLLWRIGMGIAGAVFLIGGILLWNKTSQSPSPSIPVDTKDTAAVIAHIGTLIRLPDDEQPTFATVSDLNPLKGQVFFTHAQIGDVVLLYAKSRKAILYSPKENKIIEVAPIVDGTQ